MSKRSTKISLFNNTPFDLDLVPDAGQLCHGKWTQNPPGTIPARVSGTSVTPGTWESRSGGDIPVIGNIATGTEGWVKYTFAPGQQVNVPDPPEVVYIHWDNPYVWAGGTTPSDQQVSKNDVTPPCNKGHGAWSNESFGGVPVTVAPTTQVFIMGISSNNQALSWGTGPIGEGFTIALAWPGLVLVGLAALQQDINIQITLGLRQCGSVVQSICGFYLGANGLKTLASSVKQPSLRKLFSL